jgi:hypothetical protein
VSVRFYRHDTKTLEEKGEKGEIPKIQALLIEASMRIAAISFSPFSLSLFFRSTFFHLSFILRKYEVFSSSLK